MSKSRNRRPHKRNGGQTERGSSRESLRREGHKLLVEYRDTHRPGAELVDATAHVQALVNPQGVKRCDFCGDRLPSSWVRFGASSWVRGAPYAGGPVAVALLGGWGACSACAPLVRERRWREVICRVRMNRVRFMPGIDLALAMHLDRCLAAMYADLDRRLDGTESEVSE